MKLRIQSRGKVIVSGGGGSTGAYDTLHGTATDANGWITFGLNTGSRRVWVDDQRPDDSGDGLTPATAKKTFYAGMGVFMYGGFHPGDQIMFAGGSAGGNYVDLGSTANPGGGQLGNYTFFNGISKTYPTAVLCYDRADPTNAAKYGKLLGNQRPVIDLSTVSGTTVFRKSADVGNTDHYCAWQGLIFDGKNVAGASLEHDGRHDAMVFQNITWRSTELLLNNAGSSYGFSQNCHVSKCTFYGAWFTDGNCAGMFDHGTNALWVTDCAFLHCAWKIGASRDDATSAGGTHSGGQGHGHYHHATSTNAVFRRNIYGDNSADGFNARGDVIASDIVTIDEPIALTFGGFSGSASERPEGVLQSLTNFLCMGGNSINTSQPRAFAFNIANCLPGSVARNGVIIENPNYGGTNSYYNVQNATADGNGEAQGFLFDQLRGYNWSNRLQTVTDSTNLITTSWTNCLIDVAAVGWRDGTITSSGGNAISSGASFPLKKTPAQIYTAMGFASRNAMFDAIAMYPDLPWAQALISIGLPAYGTSSTTSSSISPPDISGLPSPTVISWGS